MNWIYNNAEFSEELIGNHVAFVYKITNLLDNRVYFGKKRFKFYKRKKYKNRKNRKKVTTDSDWKTYYGSSEELQADIRRLGENNFQREIIKLCKTLSESSYHEAKLQFESDALLHPDKYYNHWISVRLNRKHLKF